MMRDKTDWNWAQYQKSDAWKNKIGYQQWLKNPNQTEPKAAASITPKSISGPNPNYQAPK